MITVDQIIEILLLESGQFISDLDATLLDKPKIELMIKRELGFYSRYMPNKVTTFGRLFNGKVFSEDVDGFIPNAIVDIRTENNIYPLGFSISPVPAPVHNYYWRYEKPVLYIKYPDASYTYSYIDEHRLLPNPSAPTTNYIPSIQMHDRVINLILGRFLMTVGKSRRAFTVDEIPITVDASEMISEGKELYDSTVEEIKLNSRFNLAVLV